MIFIAVGSSIGNAEEIFAKTEAWLNDHNCYVVAKSKILKNPPMGGVAQNDFHNAVWQVHFAPSLWNKINWVLLPQSRKKRLLAYKLLRTLKKCEKVHGRVPAERWADRTLDLDILMFGDLVMNRTRLAIPHPEIANRSFVLQPWKELVDAHFEIPNLGLLKDL